MSRFQQFSPPATDNDHTARLAALRAQMKTLGLDGFLVPRADIYQGEYVAESDARLAWLTGFTGSAGFAIISPDKAGVFIDGRYRVQVKHEVDDALYTPVAWPETRPADWLRAVFPSGGVVGFDPWLHSRKEITALEQGLTGAEIELRAVSANPIDSIWADRPQPPVGLAREHPVDLAGESSADKRQRLATGLRAKGVNTAFLSLPDSISWLLNIRGADIPKNPVVQSLAILSADSHVTVFAEPEKFTDALRVRLGNDVTILPPARLADVLAELDGPVQLDPLSAPEAAFRLLEQAGVAIVTDSDPAVFPKARKNPAELSGMRAAHLRDGAAMIRLLAWLEQQKPSELTEIDVVRQLEASRIKEGITDISFDTICGSGPNGAIIHYRVNETTNRRLAEGELLLIDSGGQYPDGTTDITRTIAIGAPPAGAVQAFTAVLRGMIAVSRAKFPKGVAGAHIDALARQYLWMDGMDYDHGTGHGVGAALCVHEGPARISRISDIPLKAGMVLSNEPGYYREGAFGIRIENLVHVIEVDAEPGRQMLGFETLTLCPIDLRLIDTALMSREEIDWLNHYHQRVIIELSPLVDSATGDWLAKAAAPLAPASA